MQLEQIIESEPGAQAEDHVRLTALIAGRSAKVSSALALELLALALAVFLWGLGYKLSLYHHHSRADQCSGVAKLWINPRHPATPRVLQFRGNQGQFARVQASASWIPEPIFPIGSVSDRTRFAPLFWSDTGVRSPRAPPFV